MRVTNTTKAVINYNGMTYGPGASFEIADEHSEGRDIVSMLGDGRLSMSVGDAPKRAASDGLSLDEIKKALADRQITFDAGMKKADLAKILDAA